MATFTYQERFKTAKGVFDAFTNRTLFDLQTKGDLDELVSPLKVGKESNVFIGTREGKRVIVKIYRIQNADFKRMWDYIKQDPRYDFLKNNRRMIILNWVQREYKNLIKAYKAGVHVPEVYAWKHNVIIMEMIGDVAPPLKDAYPENPEEFFDLIVDQMQTLYSGGLIHGDLSSFNILNDEEKPVLIDFSQGTVVKTPNCEELLVRDVKNVCRFFAKLGLEKNEAEIMEKILPQT